MNYSEGTKYKLQADYYESILLECVYVEDNTIQFGLYNDHHMHSVLILVAISLTGRLINCIG